MKYETEETLFNSAGCAISATFSTECETNESVYGTYSAIFLQFQLWKAVFGKIPNACNFVVVDLFCFRFKLFYVDKKTKNKHF